METNSLKIPLNIILDEEVPWTAKAMYGLITQSPTQLTTKQLGFFLGLQLKQVRYHLQLLIELNYLTTDKKLPKNVQKRTPDLEPLLLLLLDNNNRRGVIEKSTVEVVSDKFFKTDKIRRKNQPHKIDKLISYWNSSPNTRSHKRDTKTYKLSYKLLEQLMVGSFFTKNYFDLEFLKSIKEDNPKLVTQCWTGQQIKWTLSNLHQLYVVGFWPRDKDSLPKNLASLLYNERTQKSLFIFVTINPPKLNVPNDTSGLTHHLASLNTIFTTKIMFGKQLKDFYKQHDMALSTRQKVIWQRAFPTVEIFAEKTAKWFSKQKLDRGFSIRMVDQESRLWGKYCDYLTDEVFAGELWGAKD